MILFFALNNLIKHFFMSNLIKFEKIIAMIFTCFSQPNRYTIVSMPKK